MLSIGLYILFKLANNPIRGYYYYPHLVAEDIETSRSDVTCQGLKADGHRVRFLIWQLARSLSEETAQPESLPSWSISTLLLIHIKTMFSLTEERTEAQSRKQPVQSHLGSLWPRQTQSYSPPCQALSLGFSFLMRETRGSMVISPGFEVLTV